MRQFDAPNPPPRLPAETTPVADPPLVAALTTYNQWVWLVRGALALYVMCLLIFKRRAKSHFE